MPSRTIKVDYLARVEGEGALYVKIKDHTAVDVTVNRPFATTTLASRAPRIS
jgi:hypothetical protein